MKLKKINYIQINKKKVHVDLTLKEKSINLLIGSNGIGKTSFIKKLLDDKVDGSFCFQDRLRSINSLRGNDLVLSLKEENVINTELMDELILKFNLSDHLNKEINDLSGGENQSLKLAVNLSRKENTLIFDEPSQYLDDERVQVFKKFLYELIQTKTILIIEHNYEYLKDLSPAYLKMSYVDDHIELKNV